jgi:tRNA dimethylallyltransferase
LIDPSRFWILEQETDTLRKRINDRVDTMIQAGWIEETKRLLEAGLRKNTTACQAIGYKQIMDHLDDQLSLEETLSLIKTKTWQFAKRQRTWFRHQSRGIQIQMTAENRQETLNTLLRSIA